MKNLLVILCGTILSFICSIAPAKAQCHEGTAKTWTESSTASSPRRFVEVTNHCKEKKKIIIEIMNNDGIWSLAESGTVDPGESLKGSRLTKSSEYRWAILETNQGTFHANEYNLWKK